MRRSIFIWTALVSVLVCGLIAFTGLPPTDDLKLSVAPLTPTGPPCLVEPLPAIVDPPALAFENGMGSAVGAVDVTGLTKATARALERFQKVVISKGGTVTITSAYRPPSYQQHLQSVWDKWMHEMRNNYEPACQKLRVQVAKEFTRHRLLETQRPVDSSDHTRGLAFDAAVTLPNLTKPKARRFSLDRLARLCLLRRPDIHHDPVHYRFALAPRRGRAA